MPTGHHLKWATCPCRTCQARRGERMKTKDHVHWMINKDLMAILRQTADDRLTSMTNIVEEALWKYFEKR